MLAIHPGIIKMGRNRGTEKFLSYFAHLPIDFAHVNLLNTWVFRYFAEYTTISTSDASTLVVPRQLRGRKCDLREQRILRGWRSGLGPAAVRFSDPMQARNGLLRLRHPHRSTATTPTSPPAARWVSRATGFLQALPLQPSQLPC